MGRTQILFAGQPLLSNVVRLRCVPWHHPRTASQTIKSIETQSYLTRMWSKDDKRSVQLVLTNKAWAVLANDPFESLVRVADSLPPSVHGNFTNALQRMLDQVARERGNPRFGTCTSCKHLESDVCSREGQTLYECGFMSEPLLLEELDGGLHQLHPGQAHYGEGPCHRSRTAMSPVPASAITIADGEITLDAELLAPKLSQTANTPITQVCSALSGSCHDCHSYRPSSGENCGEQPS